MSQSLLPKPRGRIYLFVMCITLGLVVLVTLVTAFILIGFFIEYRGRLISPDVLGIQGYAENTNSSVKIVTAPKTLWDLSELLIVPVMLALGAAFLELSMRERQHIIEEGRFIDTKYRDYINSIQMFILEQNLLDPTNNLRSRTLAQAHTRDIIKIISGVRVGSILDFLESYQFDLIGGIEPIISLQDLKFTKAYLKGKNLRKVNLNFAGFEKSNWQDAICSSMYAVQTNFQRSNLRGAWFFGCDFQNTDFRYADLRQATFESCDLRGAQFDNAKMKNVTFRDSQLKGISWNWKTRLGRRNKILFCLSNAKWGKKELSGEDLSYTNLRELDLSGLNFSRANLSQCDLSGSNLRGTDLLGANLCQARLTNIQVDSETKLEPKWRTISEILSHPEEGRNLEGNDLSCANLEEAYLKGANLRNANLSGANLMKAYLENANLTNVILQSPDPFSYEVEGTSIETEMAYANLTGADLSGVKFHNIEHPFVNLRNVKTDSETQISEKWKNIIKIMGSRSQTENLNLAGQDLSSAYLCDASFLGMDLTSTNLMYCDLTGADFRRADLSQANLGYSNLRLANFYDTKLICANLTGANLAQAKLVHTKLQGADLTQASLRSAILDEANLTTAILQDTDFRAATISNTIMQDGTKKSNIERKDKV